MMNDEFLALAAMNHSFRAIAKVWRRQQPNWNVYINPDAPKVDFPQFCRMILQPLARNQPET
jgi:hypothetical protein